MLLRDVLSCSFYRIQISIVICSVVHCNVIGVANTSTVSKKGTYDAVCMSVVA